MAKRRQLRRPRPRLGLTAAAAAMLVAGAVAIPALSAYGRGRIGIDNLISYTAAVKPRVRAPRSVSPRQVTPQTTAPPPSTATAPPSTITAIPSGAPPPSTLPLETTAPSGHVSALFAILSGAGVAVVLLILVTQAILTRPRRTRRWTL